MANISDCDLCGLLHETQDCCNFQLNHTIVDRIVPSHARLTLPSSLCLIGTDDNHGIITLTKIEEGTQFGPFQAPRQTTLKEMPSLPFQVFATDQSSVGMYFDTSEENLCNWMCLVRTAPSYKDSNVVAIQIHQDIFFRSRKNINEGEELLVAYSVHYARKMERSNSRKELDHEVSQLPYHKNSVIPAARAVQVVKPTFPVRRRGRPEKPLHHIISVPEGSTHEDEVRSLSNEAIAVPKRDDWTCSQCGATYNDGLEFAHHYQKHFSTSQESTLVTTKLSSKQVNSKSNKQKHTSASETKANSSSSIKKPIRHAVNKSLVISSEPIIQKRPRGRPRKKTESNDQLPVHVKPTEQNDNTVNTTEVDKEGVLKNNNQKSASISSTYNLRAKRKAIFSEIDEYSENDSEPDNDVKPLGDGQEIGIASNDESVNTPPLNKVNNFEEAEESLNMDQSISSKDNLSKIVTPGRPFEERNEKSLSQTRETTKLLESSQKPSSNEHSLKESNMEDGQSDLAPKATKYKKGNKKAFECDVCGSHFTNQFYLFRHIKKHTGEFTCYRCRKAFSRKASLINHTCIARKLLSCSICGKKYHGEKTLAKHMFIHSNNPFECQECQKNFSSKMTLQNHACSESKESFPCPVCKKIFLNQYLMLKHIPRHTGQFSCPLCNKWLVSQFSAHTHLLACSKVKEIQETGKIICPNCGREFCEVAEYRAHELSHTHAFQCQHCGAYCNSQAKFEAHCCIGVEVICSYCSESFNGIPNLQQHDCPKFCRRYQCNQCKFYYKHEYELKQHECLLELGKTLSVKSNLLMCELCGNNFSSLSTLNSHKLLHGEKLFQCEVCEKRFHRKDQLNEHKTTHTEASVPCPDCGKLFKSKKILRFHFRIHESSKKFSCSICNKQFHQRGNLQKHQETHSLFRSFECEACGKVYKSRESFTKHQHLHNAGTPFKCLYCDKAFARAYLRNVHHRIQHTPKEYRCKYCPFKCKVRNYLKKHLGNKHFNLAVEWKKEGAVEAMYLDIQDNTIEETPDDEELGSAEDAKILLAVASLQGDNPEQDMVGDILGVEEEVQTSNSVIINPIEIDVPLEALNEQTELQRETFDILADESLLGESELSITSNENIQPGDVSEGLLLNNKQIEELQQKLQEEHSGTFILNDGTIIQQQQEENGVSDVLFFVIPPDNSNLL